MPAMAPNTSTTSGPTRMEAPNASASSHGRPSSVILQTRLHRAPAILEDKALAETLTNFINEGYGTSSIYPATHWDYQPIRFHTPTEIHEMVGTDGLIAAVYQTQADGDQTDPVAAASITRWHGDMDGTGGQDEDGWEIKAVTTKSGWAKMGLVGWCIEAMTQDLITQEKEKGDNGERKLKLWLHAVEEVNGDYWRRRGWRDVRGFSRPVGYWGSKFGFRLAVLIKEIDVD